LSSYILEHKDEYAYNLAAVTGTRNWKPWLGFMLEAVSQTSEYTIHKIGRIRALMEKTGSIIRQQRPSLARLEIPRLFEQPYIRPRNLMGNKIKSVNTAKKYLTELEDLGFLTSEKIGKEQVWFNTELMDILSD